MMKVYADYEFYISEYGTDMSENEFAKYIKPATQYIKRLTLQRSEDYTGEELKYAACAVAEAYWRFDTANPDGKIVSSENNDGFSQSFVTGSKSFDRQRADKAYGAAKTWLSGTGLLSRRVNNCADECRHNCL